MRERSYRRMFLLGALWNLAGGAFILAAGRWIFGLDDLSIPQPGAYYYSWIALFLTFGIGYYMAYRDPLGNRAIALLGTIGKLAFAAIFLWYLLGSPGSVPRFFFIPVIGDIIFAVLYARFWLATRDAVYGTARGSSYGH
jgi:hypothetical protein